MRYINPEPELADGHDYVFGTCDQCAKRGPLVEYWAPSATGMRWPVLALCFDHAMGTPVERALLKAGYEIGRSIDERAVEIRAELHEMATKFLVTHQPRTQA